MFITFEGGEGSGKTTIIEKLYQTLTNQGYEVISTREPGGSNIAEQIRKILLDNENINIKAHTEALLFAASRAQHLDEVIIPNLDKIILCDRYLDSSIAYQAYGRDLGEDFVYKINSYALEFMPNITFFIKVEPKIGLERISSRRVNKKDRLDKEENAFHQKVYEGYLKVANNNPERVIVIDGTLSIEEIFNQVLNEILKRL